MNKIKYIEGDLFADLKTDESLGPIVVPHCCNNRGGYGAGFVVPLSKNYPATREQYYEWFDKKEKTKWTTGIFALGETQFVNIDDRIIVANMIAQTLAGNRPLYYNHLSRCLDSVANHVVERTNSREYPCKIMAPAFGSGLAGGEWNIISKLIEDSWLKRNIDVTIYYLPGTLTI